MNKRRSIAVGLFIKLIGLKLFSPLALAATAEEGQDFAKQLHNRGYSDQSHEMNTLQQAYGQKPENQHLHSQNGDLSATFEGNFDSGKKDEDPLKSYLWKKTIEASKNTPSTQPTGGDAELFLKQKHRFQISSDDALFKRYDEISQSALKTESDLFQPGQSVKSTSTLKDKIVTCRQGVAPELRTCTKHLVVTAAPQEPLVKTVTAYFTARCYNLVTFSIDLKAGKIGVSQCENQGSVNVSVIDPIGEPEQPDKTTVELMSRQHYGEGGVDFRAGQMSPAYANGFTASFTAFQPNTGRKKSHEGNKNNVRGGQYTWKITMPRHPTLKEYWEGCEVFERQALEQSCEMISLEPQNINESRDIAGFPQPIIRPHWTENKEFLCGGGREIDECSDLSNKNVIR